MNINIMVAYSLFPSLVLKAPPKMCSVWGEPENQAQEHWFTI